jgi:AAHS family 4-hydroxybenzoate transporter-like MFS transporter
MRKLLEMVVMNGSVNIDVTRFVDDRRLSGFQIWIIVICFLTSFADGLDSQIMSVTLPFIRRDISLAPSSLGHLLSASQFGALIGALLFGLVADKWGRRPVIIASSVIFSVGTFATAYSHSFESLMFLRFFAGIGIGGAIPSYIALVAEYTPLRNRALVTAIIVSAVPCGGIFAGFIGAVGLGADGWAIG